MRNTDERRVLSNLAHDVRRAMASGAGLDRSRHMVRLLCDRYRREADEVRDGKILRTETN